MNAAEHRLGSSIALGAAVSLCTQPEDVVPRTAAACAGGYCFASQPDLVEPTSHSMHRLIDGRM